MNLTHLRYFCKLAETQHYTLAASELYISQPGLSGAISSLEDELGIPLFEKKGRNVRLNKYGKEFYNYVTESLRILDNGIAVAQEHAGDLSGTIDIGCIPTISGNYAACVTTHFKTSYPKIRFNIYQGQTNALLPGLSEDKYDLCFCSYNEHQPGMSSVPIMTQSVVAAVHENHPLAGKESIVLSELTDYPVLTYSLSQQIGRQFTALMKKYKLDIAPMDNFCDEEILAGTIIQEAAINDHPTSVALVADVSALNYYPNLIRIPISDVPEDFRTIYMVFKGQTFKTHAVEQFITYIRENHSLR